MTTKQFSLDELEARVAQADARRYPNCAPQDAPRRFDEYLAARRELDGYLAANSTPVPHGPEDLWREVS